MTDFNGWNKKAKQLLQDDESDEERQKEESNKALGLDGSVQGPPVAKAKEQQEEFNKQSEERQKVIDRMKALEESYIGITENKWTEEEPSVKKASSFETRLESNSEFGLINSNDRAIKICKAKDSNLRITGKSIKVMLSVCTNCTFDIRDTVVTSTAEIYGSENCTVNIRAPIQSIQIDQSKDITFDFEDALMGNFIVQHGCENLKFRIGGKDIEMDSKSVDTSTDKEVQYVTRIIKNDNSDSFRTCTEIVQRHSEKEFPTFLKGDDAAPSAMSTKDLSTDDAAEAAAKKQAGNDAFKSNDFLQAAAMYTLSLAAVNDPVVLSNRAQCWLKTGAFEKAVADCEEGLKLNEKNPKLHFRRGMALQATAQQELEKEADRKFNRNHIQYKDIQKWLQEALKSFGDAERLDPKNKQVKEAIGFAQMKLNKAMKLGLQH